MSQKSGPGTHGGPIRTPMSTSRRLSFIWVGAIVVLAALLGSAAFGDRQALLQMAGVSFSGSAQPTLPPVDPALAAKAGKGSPSDRGDASKPTNAVRQEGDTTGAALNVVYFYVKGGAPHPDYRERISGILEKIRNDIHTDMDRMGFQNSWMRLDHDADGLVTIRTVEAQSSDPAQYDADNYRNVRDEVESYFVANPEQRRSKHTLIISPSNFDDSCKPLDNLPYFGAGMTSFVTDFEGMSVDLWNDPATQLCATIYIGGLYHELGHALNAGHEHSTVPGQATYGESVMSAANWTYGMKPTTLTPGTAAIFNQNEIFQPGPVTNWYAEHKIRVQKMQFYQDTDGNLRIIGEFKTKADVASIIMQIDPSQEGQTYDAVGYADHSGAKTFDFTVPMSDLEKTTASSTMRVGVVFADGVVNYRYKKLFVLKNGKTRTKVNIDRGAGQPEVTVGGRAFTQPQLPPASELEYGPHGR